MKRIQRTTSSLLLLALLGTAPLVAAAGTPLQIQQGGDPQSGERQGAEGPPGHAPTGSPHWYAWVNRTLGIKALSEGGPAAGTDAWNRAVAQKLGRQAPNEPPGSQPWLHTVDALVRIWPAPGKTH